MIFQQNMTARLHHLTSTTEKKDVELNELRKTIDKLKQAGCDAGLLKEMVWKSTNCIYFTNILIIFFYPRNLVVMGPMTLWTPYNPVMKILPFPRKIIPRNVLAGWGTHFPRHFPKLPQKAEHMDAVMGLCQMQKALKERGLMGTMPMYGALQLPQDP